MAAAAPKDDVPNIVVPKLITRNRTVDDTPEAKGGTLRGKKSSVTGTSPSTTSPAPSGSSGGTPVMAPAPLTLDGSKVVPPLSLSVAPGASNGSNGASGASSNGASSARGTSLVPTGDGDLDGPTQLDPNQADLDIAAGPVFTEDELDIGRKWKFTLSFPIKALEAYYLLYYRSRSIQLARLAFSVVLIVNTIAAYTDTFVYSSDQLPTIYAIRYGGIEPICIGILLFLWFPRFERYRQIVTAFWVLSVGALLIAISYVSTTPDHGVYMVFFFACYLFVGLRFMYTAGMCWLLFIMFNIVNYVCTYDRLGERRQWLESFGYLFLTNLMLMVVGYIIESSLRSAFLKLQKLRLEQTRTNKILRNILPEEMVENLLEGKLTADYYQAASVLFCDIYDFKAISSDLPARDLVGMMNRIFSQFDSIIDRFQAIKIETIGEVYMAASGLPQVADWHAENLCYLALAMQKELSGFRAPPVEPRYGATEEQIAEARRGKRIQLRIGVNTGKTIAGVIGLKLPRYRLFGDTVNTASRMQSTCLPEKIQISEVVYDAVNYCMNTTYRGTIPVKGKGEMKTWFIDSASRPQDPGHNVNINVQSSDDTANMFAELLRSEKDKGRPRDIYDDDPEDMQLVTAAARRESAILSKRSESVSHGIGFVGASSAPASSASPLGMAITSSAGSSSPRARVASVATDVKSPGGAGVRHDHIHTHGSGHETGASLVAAAAGTWARDPTDSGALIKRRSIIGRNDTGVDESPARGRGASRATPSSANAAPSASPGGDSYRPSARRSVSSAAGPGRFHPHMRSASLSHAQMGAQVARLIALDEKKATPKSGDAAATPAPSATPAISEATVTPSVTVTIAADSKYDTKHQQTSQSTSTSPATTAADTPLVPAAVHSAADSSAVVIELPTLGSSSKAATATSSSSSSSSSSAAATSSSAPTTNSVTHEEA